MSAAGTAMRPTQAAGLAGWLLLVGAAAAVGGLGSASAGAFYAQLTQPTWAPPGWLFGPVWSLLYLLMAIAAWLVWRRARWSGSRPALSLFVIQLAFNALWSWLFFAWQLGGAAFVEVLALLVLVIMTAWAFWRQSRLAALLLAPYAAWVAFAAALNLAMWQLNPVAL